MHHEAEAVALPHATGLEAERHFDEFIEIVAAGDAVAVAERGEARVVSCQRARVRNRLFLAALAAADLHGDDRLARQQGALASLAKCLGATDAFEKDHDD